MALISLSRAFNADLFSYLFGSVIAIYELADENRHHHHHLVCVDCESVVCIHFCPEADVYEKHAKDAGFRVLGHIFEVYGRCSAREKTKAGLP